MAILKVARLGHPILRQIAQPLSRDEMLTHETQDFIDDMIKTMQEYDGVGLAAPQVYVSKQVVVIESQQSPRYPDAAGIPLMVIMNPQVEFLTDNTIEFWEGCLSVPELRGKVSRCENLRLTYFNRSAEKVTLETDQFLAIVIQHEIDHLLGKVFLDRMNNLSTLTFLTEYQKYWIKSS
jgi:peptide deformylase